MAEPASITHQSVAIEAPAGPEGSSVDSGPCRRRSVATIPSWKARRNGYDDGPSDLYRDAKEAGDGRADDRATQPQSAVMLELLRLDIGSAVALVGTRSTS